MFHSFAERGLFSFRAFCIACFAAAFLLMSGCAGSFPEGTSETAEPEWAVYLTELADAGPASIITDLALQNTAPVAGKEVLIAFTLVMQSPRVDGLSSSSEADRLNEIDETISEPLRQKHGAVYAGRLNHAGKLTLYFYVPRNSGAKRAIEAAMAAYPDYRFHIEANEEPGWETYLGFLYPKPDKLRSIRNGMVVDRLIEAGDTLERKRPVEHWAYFPDTDSLNRSIAAMIEKGFRVEGIETADVGDKPFSVRFSRSDYVDHESIDGNTLELWRYATELGGKYDGWETHVMIGDDDKNRENVRKGTLRQRG